MKRVLLDENVAHALRKHLSNHETVTAAYTGFEQHRRQGDVHIHFLGAHSLSFGQGVELKDGDVMDVHFDGFSRPLRNPVQVAREKDALVEVIPRL